jgi:hypothetical protein
VPAPGRLVARLELLERAAVVGGVAEREHGAGVGVEQDCRLLVTVRVAACDVARRENDGVGSGDRAGRLRERKRDDGHRG